MAKRKSGSDQPEQDGSHRSKKAKIHNVPVAADDPEPPAGQISTDRLEQQSVHDGGQRSRKAKRRATKVARQQRHEERSASKTALPENKGIARDGTIPGQPLNPQGMGREKKGQGQDPALSLGKNRASKTINVEEPKAGHVDVTPGQPSRRRSQNHKKQGRGEEKHVIGGAFQAAKVDTENRKNNVDGGIHNIPAWSASEAVGGQMLDLDPLFSPDEQYLFIAYQSSVNVYSTATSLLVRKLRAEQSEPLAGLALSAIDSSHLYVAAKSGNIQKWDWLEGRILGSWDTECRIYALAAPQRPSDNRLSDLVYTIDQKAMRPWRIRVHRLVGANENDAVTLRTSQEPITSFNITENGRIITAASGSVLTLGITSYAGEPPLSNLSYTWRDIECPEWISCYDVRTVELDDGSKGKTCNNQRIPRIDIAVGGLKGSLHVYDDLLRQLIQKEKTADKRPTAELTSRKMHWHRNAILSVKWSRDGNYIISGGLETVLMIWQLETGSYHTLPHLGAPLEGIVVSPSGSSYAVRLADNSAMILSTAELKPTFSVAGIQLPAKADLNAQLPLLLNVDAPQHNAIPPQKLRFPVASGPSNLLCAVPSATPSRVPSTLPQNASYLQTFDVASVHQLSRQALTRTKATDLNVGPESNTIEEPNVTLMQVSHDGQWLATVDEWTPPKRDLAVVTCSDADAIEEGKIRNEIYLKFWSWNKESKIWTLVSRIDDPHASQSGFAERGNRVLDLTADPSSVTFATVGEDGTVRTWAPSTRQRHGSAIKNKEGEGLMGWRCRSTLTIDAGAFPPQPFTEAKLAYAHDGSCLAVACVSSSPWTIHFIDTTRGTARTGPYGPFTGSLHGLGIVDKYLVLLSEELYVWNLVTYELVYVVKLAPELSRFKHMAVDVQRGTFAVALSEGTGSTLEEGQVKHGSEIMIFESASPVQTFVQTIPQPTTALIPLHDRAGYIAIDTTAEVRTFTPRHRGVDPTTALPTPPQTPSRGLQEIYGGIDDQHDVQAEDAQTQIAAHISANSVEFRVEDDEVHVVPPEKLAEVFDVGAGHTMPPVTDLFERVARLFAGKTTT
ncbi:MAG: hypothetical protein Q9184_002375 [Pyrenodesmia sp. 2 TL-2023]